MPFLLYSIAISIVGSAFLAKLEDGLVNVTLFFIGGILVGSITFGVWGGFILFIPHFIFGLIAHVIAAIVPFLAFGIIAAARNGAFSEK